jgi:hypothetical protein
MPRQNKEKEAKEEMKRKMKELEQARRDEKRGRGKGMLIADCSLVVRPMRIG